MHDTAESDIDRFVTLLNGTRARLADLEAARRSGLREAAASIGTAHRALLAIESSALSRAEKDPEFAAAFFEAIKTTHDGGMQRFSQRLRTRMPSR